MTIPRSLLVAWADHCGIDITDDRAVEPDRYGWPKDFGFFRAGWDSARAEMGNELSGNSGRLPPQDMSRANREQGLFRKFNVSRTDGSDFPGGKHDGCDYFVLDMTHDPYAKAAAAAYANACEGTHPVLAADLRKRHELP